MRVACDRVINALPQLRGQAPRLWAPDHISVVSRDRLNFDSSTGQSAPMLQHCAGYLLFAVGGAD